MNILKRIVKFIYSIITIFVIALLVISAYCLIQRYILNKNHAEVFGYTFFQIQTGSMSGTIEIDDIIIVKITDDVHEKDIITYTDNDSIITHRLITENGNTLITKGDANNTEDKPIERKQVIGKVEKIFSGLGTWIKVFTDWKVIACIVVTFLFLGLAISDEDKNKKRRRKHSLWNGVKNWFNHIREKNSREDK